MKKIICMLLLFQAGIMMAQTETFVTVNGKKVKINPNSLNTADNGLSANEGNVQLGGALNRNTSITTGAYTLAIKGLEAGKATDNVVVTDENGVLKTINASSVSNIKGVKVIHSDYTVADADYTLIVSQLSNDITVALPDAATSEGRVLLIAQTNVSNSSGAEVTVKFNVPVIYSDKFSVNEIAAPFYSATGGTLKVTLQSDGANWKVVSSL